MSPERPVRVNVNGSGGTTASRIASASAWIPDGDHRRPARRSIAVEIMASSVVAHRSGRGSSSGSIVPALAALSAVALRRATRWSSDGPAVRGQRSTSTGWPPFRASDWKSVWPVRVDALVTTHARRGGEQGFEADERSGVRSEQVGRRQHTAALEAQGWWHGLLDEHPGHRPHRPFGRRSRSARMSSAAGIVSCAESESTTISGKVPPPGSDDVDEQVGRRGRCPAAAIGVGVELLGHVRSRYR